MTAQQDLDRALGAWLHEVPPHSDRARATVLARIASTPQQRRRSWVPGEAARPTDAAARPTRRYPSMFSATRLIAAIAIVALGTGTLFFAASPGPVPTPTALPSTSPIPGPSLVTEMVAPGVVRVLGVRETASPTAPWVFRMDEPGDTAMNHTGIGPDGTVWILETGRLLRLDDPAQWPMEAADRPDLESLIPAWNEDIRVTADGTVFMSSGLEIRSFDGTGWTTERTGTLFDGQGDGAIWAHGGGLARWADDRWTEWPVGDRYVSTAAATPDGVAWLGLGLGGGTGRDQGLWRIDGSGMTAVALPGDPNGRATLVAVGLDGTLWVYLVYGFGQVPARYLARLTAVGWTVFEKADGVPLMRDFFQGGPGHLAVGPDGRAWLTPQQDPRPLERKWWVDDCHGVVSFDGVEWTTYLQDVCVVDLDVAPDGDVWVQTLVPDEDRHWIAGPTYRITPER